MQEQRMRHDGFPFASLTAMSMTSISDAVAYIVTSLLWFCQHGHSKSAYKGHCASHVKSDARCVCKPAYQICVYRCAAKILSLCQTLISQWWHCAQATEQVAEEQKEATARTAKMRTLGNIRLIAELFKKSVVPEKIVLVCVQDLMGDPKQEPSENNVEVCRMVPMFPSPATLSQPPP